MNDEKRTLEDMDEPCPDDICNGDGRITDEDGNEQKCPHVLGTDQHDPDRD